LDVVRGLFYVQIGAGLEVKMANTRQNDRRKGTRRESTRRKGDINAIKIEGKKDKAQEVTVLHEPPLRKKAGSVWGWHEEFTAEWSETLITRKRKKHPK